MDSKGACLSWPRLGGGRGWRGEDGAGRSVPCPPPRLLGGAESHTSLPAPTPSSPILGKSQEFAWIGKGENLIHTHVFCWVTQPPGLLLKGFSVLWLELVSPGSCLCA